MKAGSPRLEDCEVSSRSGTGVGIEGALRPQLVGCRLHGCERHGLAAFGALDDELVVVPEDQAAVAKTSPVLDGCEIYGNKLNGVLVRAGGAVKMTGCSLRENGEYCLALQDAGLGSEVEGNQIDGRNGQGAVLIQSNSFDLGLEPDRVPVLNLVKGRVMVL